MRARWRGLKDRLGDIAISTIDAFCLSLLREFPLEADVDPGFELADDTEVPRLVDESLDRALRICRSLAGHDDDVALVFALGYFNSDHANWNLKLFLANLFMVQDVFGQELLNGVYWTLLIEIKFYAFLAFIPTLIAVVSVYGLVAKPEDVARQVDKFASALPQEVENFIQFQLKSIVQADNARVSIALVASIAFALWSASGGLAALITGLHVAQEQESHAARLSCETARRPARPYGRMTPSSVTIPSSGASVGSCGTSAIFCAA